MPLAVVTVGVVASTALRVFALSEVKLPANDPPVISVVTAIVLLPPARSGMVIVPAPDVCAAVVSVTACAVASAVVSFKLPLVLPLICT